MLQHPLHSLIRLTRRLAVVSLGLAAVSVVWAASPAQTLNQLADDYYQRVARFDPLAATQNGDNRFDDQLNISIAPEARRRHAAYLQRVRRQLQGVPRAQLSASDALTYDTLRYTLDSNLSLLQYPDHLLPLTHMDSVPTTLANLATGQDAQPLATVVQYDAYLRRIARLPAWLDQARRNLQMGMRQHVVMPRGIVESALPQLHQLADTALEDNAFYSPIRRMPNSFPPADQARLRSQYRQVGQRIIVALKRYTEFVQTRYLPATRATDGLGALPHGQAWYEALVRESTTTDLTPEAIHTLGLAEVARIQSAMRTTAAKLGYDGPVSGLGRWIAAQPRLRPFTTEAEILATYARLNERVSAQLPALFGLRPKAPLEIRAEPELTRDTASSHYGPPAVDGSRPGVFWAVITDPRQYDALDMATLLLHEGQPGHHFHIALQLQMPLPLFRKFGWVTAYGEGWALYAETLGHELGLYDDPVAYLGHLRAELHRAVRLVTDTGLHARGWSQAQTVRYMMDNEGVDERDALQSTQRYMAWPAQALAYKIGALKIQELRSLAQQRMGSRFSLAAFHDQVLGQGVLPLALLESRIRLWMEMP